MNKTKVTLTLVKIVVLIIVAISSFVIAYTVTPTKPQEKSIKTLYSDLAPSVVVIVTNEGQGSGVFISEDVIITNFHVVGDASGFVVSVKTQDQHALGVVIYGDPDNDLALVRIYGAKGTPVKFANSLYSNVGDQVISIGASLGLESTLGVGYITAKNREIDLEPFIGITQVSTEIFPGNSGGGLFNLKGELLGITFAGLEDASALGFVIPSNYIQYVLKEQLTNLNK